MSILLVVAVTGVVNFQTWFDTFQSSTQTKIENDGTGQVIDLNYLNSQKLYIKNPTEKNIFYSDVKINGKSCGLSGNISGKGLKEIELGFCTTGMTKGYKSIVFITDKGVFAETLKLSENGIVGNLTLQCTGGTEIFALDTATNHAELASINNFTTPICVNHNAYTISTTCTAPTNRLFYLGDTSNSHIYIDNSTAYDNGNPNYYNWQEVCLESNSGTVNLVHQLADPADGSICIVEYEQDDVYGGIVGSCNSLSSPTKKIWLNIN